jgi:hypothetical protein
VHQGEWRFCHERQHQGVMERRTAALGEIRGMQDPINAGHCFVRYWVHQFKVLG